MEKQRALKVNKVLNIIAIIMTIVGFFEMFLIIVNLIYGSINPDNSLTKSFLDSYKFATFQEMVPTLIKQLVEGFAVCLASVFGFIYTKCAKEEIFSAKANKWLFITSLITIFSALLIELAIFIINRVYSLDFKTTVTSSVLFIVGIFEIIGYFNNQYGLSLIRGHDEKED